MSPFIVTRYGKQINFLSPKASQIDIRDIAHALSRIVRFNGHTIKPYYVAQHLCLCHDQAPTEVKREALGHDFAEYAACDIPSPLKALIPQYVEIERRLEEVIARKFRFRYPWPALVKEIDHRALLTEMRDLTDRQDWKQYPAAPFDEVIVPWDSARCHREFLKRFNQLTAKKRA
jgi:5'-deoxynucleotidase YfbR-like HD superfamily hydrolase